MLKNEVIDLYSSKLFNCIINEINKERNNNYVDKKNIRNAIRVFEISTHWKYIIIEKDTLHPSGYDY